jgi:phosphatidylserine/phosphatidylglycerophosphate/cardiolipin synthase-like enzyme
MKKITLTLWTVLGLITAAHAQNIQLYFSPNGGCTDAIVRTLNSSKKSIHVQAYSFTSAPIAKALTDAHKRGVKTFVLLDKSNQTAQYSSATFLKNSGVEPLIDGQHTIAHNKVMVVDEQVVITGSFNFSKAAETSNAENLLIITDPAIAAKYLSNWNLHAKHSIRYFDKTNAIFRK